MFKEAYPRFHSVCINGEYVIVNGKVVEVDPVILLCFGVAVMFRIVSSRNIRVVFFVGYGVVDYYDKPVNVVAGSERAMAICTDRVQYKFIAYVAFA